eukprot:TRINITY_DN993_c0_g1_i3.p1 TRINITY_DN993_c0_g1~~TRINITY_DN993_c0_g1_i3.p1  ORF type:complete len:491 (+),score=82.68 TRINITY_DN993_c0_g1_i3:220-1473(+)
MADSVVFPNGIMGENYTCGWMPFASTAAKAVCPVQAGETVQVTFYNAPENSYIAENHRGAIIFYMNKYSAAGGVPTAGWFKIQQSGILEKAPRVDDYKWASPWTLTANSGKVSVKIPSDIAPGKYLLRTEILAVFDIDPRGAQPYVRCIELDVTGSGSVNPPGINIPGTMKYSDPGLSGVWWRDYIDSYPFPGPEVYREGSIATPPPAPVTTRAVTSAAVTSAPVTSKALSTARITSGAVTSGPVTSKAISSARITSGAITSAPVTSNAVSSARITSGPITSGPLTTKSLSTAKITSGPVTSGPVTSKALSTARITSGAVTSGRITSGPITSSEITSGAVTSSPLTTSPMQGGAFCAIGSCDDPNAECVDGYCVCKSGYAVNGLQCIELEGSIIIDSSSSSSIILFGGLYFMLALLL